MSPRLRPPAPRFALILVTLGAVMLAPLAWHAAFHCDETTVMRHVTRFAAGDTGRPGRPGLLWLLMSPLIALKTPALMLLGARFLAWLASVGTLVMVWRLATRPARDPAAAPSDASTRGSAAIVLLLGAVAWHGHAWEVRTDSFTTPLTLLLAWRLWRDERRVAETVGLGLLVGALGLISQKSIYNVLAVSAGALVFTAGSPVPGAIAARVRQLAGIAAMALGMVAVWYGGMTVLHGTSFVEDNASVALATAFGPGRPLTERLSTLLGAMRVGAPLWLLGGAGAVMALRDLRGPGASPRASALGVTALLMLSTPLIHRGVYLYYVASFEPLLAPLAAVPVAVALTAVGRPRLRQALAAGGVLAMFGLAAAPISSLHRVTNTQQLRLLEDVWNAFPEPTPYWDQIGLVPGYPETTFFGTAGVRHHIRKLEGQNAFVDRARARKPRFFVRNYLSRDTHLRPDERRWHWRHFIPYRANLYLLGARRVATAALADEGSRAEILLAGAYTVWFAGSWTGEASVDGRPVRHREVIELAEGNIELRARPTRGEGQLALILGAGREPEEVGPGGHVDWSLFPGASRSRFQQYDRPGEPAALRTQPSDPSVNADELAARAERHRQHQLRRDRRLGTPGGRPAAGAPAPAMDGPEPEVDAPESEAREADDSDE